MILKNWTKLPEYMKTKEIEEYYNILSQKKIQLIFKRIFDIVFSLILLILISPIFLIIGIIIKIDSRGPIFYKQERITQYGRTFKIFKFRTMVQNADSIGSLVTIGEDSRITRVGKKIRKYRIDEIPQLINIFIGDMSFVGTRPEVKKYVEKYSDEMKATLLLPAGVTSRASIEYKGEDAIISEFLKKGEEVDEIYVSRVLPNKMNYNFKYLKNFSLLEDIKIMFETVIKVIK